MTYNYKARLRIMKEKAIVILIVDSFCIISRRNTKLLFKFSGKIMDTCKA